MLILLFVTIFQRCFWYVSSKLLRYRYAHRVLCVLPTHMRLKIFLFRNGLSFGEIMDGKICYVLKIILLSSMMNLSVIIICKKLSFASHHLPMSSMVNLSIIIISKKLRFESHFLVLSSMANLLFWKLWFFDFIVMNTLL